MILSFFNENWVELITALGILAAIWQTNKSTQKDLKNVIKAANTDRRVSALMNALGEYLSILEADRHTYYLIENANIKIAELASTSPPSAELVAQGKLAGKTILDAHEDHKTLFREMFRWKTKVLVTLLPNHKESEALKEAISDVVDKSGYPEGDLQPFFDSVDNCILASQTLIADLEKL